MACQGLSVACCTRDRPADFRRLVASLIRARALAPGLALEFLVIDDGELPEVLCRSAAAALAAARIAWRYHNKRADGGLLRSRLAAVRLAAFDWILFLDDDVELAADYLAVLQDRIGSQPGLAGIGGVDLLSSPRSLWRQAACLVLGLEPWRLGRLSFGGHPAGLGRLRSAAGPVRAQRLYGCNMGFRKAALRELRLLPGFTGYSLGEDAYLSLVAGRCGPLLVDPALQVLHYHSPAARDGSFAFGRASVLNHHLLLRLHGLSPWHRPGWALSLAALVALSMLRWLGRRSPAARDMLRGQLAGLGELRRRMRPPSADLPLDLPLG